MVRKTRKEPAVLRFAEGSARLGVRSVGGVTKGSVMATKKTVAVVLPKRRRR